MWKTILNPKPEDLNPKPTTKDWEDNGAMMILLGGGSADEPSTWRTAFERMKAGVLCRALRVEVGGPLIESSVFKGLGFRGSGVT